MLIAERNAESSVLGGLLVKPEAFDEVSHLEPSDFGSQANQRIYRAIHQMIHDGEAVDVFTVHNKVKDDADLAYMTDLITNTPSVANISHYANIVKEHAQRRGLSAVAHELSESVYGDVRLAADTAQAQIEAVMGVNEKNEPVLAADDLIDYLDEFERRKSGEGTAVFATGFADLDRMLNGGIRGGDIIMIAARPKCGKTTLAMNIAVNIARNHNVLFLSQEMRRRDLHDRNIARLGKVPLSWLLRPNEDDDLHMRMIRAIEIIQGLKLHVDDQGALTPMDVRLKARAVKRKHGLDVLVIDYLQLMRGSNVGKNDSRNNEVESIMRSLKALALEMDIPIILLSQLNRSLESRTNKRPMPSDFRDSGSVEQDCSVALMLYRDEVYDEDSPDKGICEVNVALNRQGETGTIGMQFNGATSSFSDLAHGTLFGLAREAEEGKHKPKYSSRDRAR